MITEDQTEVIAFLESPSTHEGHPVERIDTHASIVFLAGQHAWKLKHAVRYDYLDFSSAERRKAMCEAEVRVNRRTAAAVYRGVVAVTREHDGALASADLASRWTGSWRWRGSIRRACSIDSPRAPLWIWH
jgi:uncharacterized protein